MDMKERLQELAEAAGKRISESEGLEKLHEVRVAYLGKKGELTAILKSMKDVAPDAVRAVADGDAPLLAEAGRQRELQILLPEKLREVRSGHGLLQRVPPAFVAPEFLFLPRGIDAGARMRLAEAHRIFINQ